MSYQAELAKLADELQDVEIQVIQDIIDYRKAHGRTSHKKIAELFGMELKHIKTIGKFMKQHSDDTDCELNSQSSTMKNIANVEKDSFSSVAELNQYLDGFGEDGDGNTAAKESTLLERMLTDYSDDEEIIGAEFTGNQPVEVSDGEKLIQHVKCFVENADNEVNSLRGDAELFDAERNGFKQEKYQLCESLRAKDHEIAQLKAELAIANKFHKENVCNRCDKPKKYVVANLRFCSISCIKQATKDLEGAENLPMV